MEHQLSQEQVTMLVGLEEHLGELWADVGKTAIARDHASVVAARAQKRFDEARELLNQSLRHQEKILGVMMKTLGLPNGDWTFDGARGMLVKKEP